MLTSRAEEESGSSLVEVLAAIIILTVAIIPMVSMFDAALGAASSSGDYDAARACAGQKLEQFKSLPYEVVAGGLSNGVCEPSGFGYEVEEGFVDARLEDVEGDRGLTKITVTVRWGEGGSYSTTGVISRW